MTFEQILVLHNIINTGSFKGASVVMHKTQPAISLAIKKLEEEMEVDLFDRSGYKPQLTEHGKIFYERSLKLIQGMGELENLSQSFKNKDEPEIFLSVDGISPLPMLLPLLKKFKEKHLYTKMNLGLDILGDTEKKVLDREADIGITHFIQEKSLLEVDRISSVKMIPVMERKLFLERKVQSQEDLREIDQIVLGDQNGPRGGSFGLLEEGKKWKMTDSHFKREIILSGLGWGHLPYHTIQRELEEGLLHVLEFEDIHPKELEIYLIRHKKHHLGRVAKNLWDELLSFKTN